MSILVLGLQLTVLFWLDDSTTLSKMMFSNNIRGPTYMPYRIIHYESDKGRQTVWRWEVNQCPSVREIAEGTMTHGGNISGFCNPTVLTKWTSFRFYNRSAGQSTPRLSTGEHAEIAQSMINFYEANFDTQYYDPETSADHFEQLKNEVGNSWQRDSAYAETKDHLLLGYIGNALSFIALILTSITLPTVFPEAIRRFKYRNLNPNRCPSCKYDLRGLPRSANAPITCPECGQLCAGPRKSANP